MWWQTSNSRQQNPYWSGLWQRNSPCQHWIPLPVTLTLDKQSLQSLPQEYSWVCERLPECKHVRHQLLSSGRNHTNFHMEKRNLTMGFSGSLNVFRHMPSLILYERNCIRHKINEKAKQIIFGLIFCLSNVMPFMWLKCPNTFCSHRTFKLISGCEIYAHGKSNVIYTQSFFSRKNPTHILVGWE